MGYDQTSRAEVRPVLLYTRLVGVSVTSDYNYINIMSLKL